MVHPCPAAWVSLCTHRPHVSGFINEAAYELSEAPQETHWRTDSASCEEGVCAWGA
jgi:hypothetical protein